MPDPNFGEAYPSPRYTQAANPPSDPSGPGTPDLDIPGVHNPDPPSDPSGPGTPDLDIPGVHNPDPSLRTPGPDGWPLVAPGEGPSPAHQYDKFPHRAFPAYFVRSGGFDEDKTPTNFRVPYFVRPDTYVERLQDKGGSTAEVNLIFDGATAQGFEKYALGYAFKTGTGGDARLRRFTPMACGIEPNLVLTDLLLIGRGECRPLPSGTAAEGWPKWNWLEYRAAFQDRPYVIAEDDEARANELYRYVERTYKPSARERRIPSYALGYEASGKVVTLPEGGFIIDQVIDHVFTWHLVPADAIPRKAVRDMVGEVNSEEFDAVTPFGINAPAETVLFKGLARDIVLYRGRNGGHYADLSFVFSERADGWNKYKDVGDELHDLRYVRNNVLTSTPPYSTADLNKLFIPE